MKKISISVLLILVGIISFAQQKRMVIIKGTITGNLNGANKMYMYTSITNDSTVIKDSHYTFTFPFKEVAMKMFVPEYVFKEHMSYRPFGILVDKPGTYYIISDKAKAMYYSEVKGSEAAELYKGFGKEQDEAYDKINKVLSDLYGKEWYKIEGNEKDLQYTEFQKSQDSLQAADVVPIIEKLVKEHPNSAASAFVLTSDGEQIGSLQQQEHFYQLLSLKMKESKEGRQFSDYINGVKNSAIGKKVKDFSLFNPKGTQIIFSRFKGKYVLVDFWASWCGPCRASFPKMREIYAFYRDKGFGIYSISIDKSKKDWLKAVEEEKNPWPQSLDTKNISKKEFAVVGIPTTYLIDPQGKIVAKQVGYDPGVEGSIELRLGELWGKMPPTSASKDKVYNSKDKKDIKKVPAAALQ